MMQDLTDRIRTWGVMRGLDTADPAKQVLKLGEEYGELCEAVVKGDHNALEDALGDMYVAMVQVATQNNTSMETCASVAYNEIKDRKGKLVNGVFVKEVDL